MDLLPIALQYDKSIALWGVLNDTQKKQIHDDFFWENGQDGSGLLDNDSDLKTLVTNYAPNYRALHDIQQMYENDNYAPIRGMTNQLNQCWFDAPIFVLLADPSGYIESQLHRLDNVYSKPLITIRNFMYGRSTDNNMDTKYIINEIGRNWLLNEQGQTTSANTMQNANITPQKLHQILNLDIKLVESDRRCYERPMIYFVRSGAQIPDGYVLYGHVYYLNGNHYTASLKLQPAENTDLWLYYNDKGIGKQLKKLDHMRLRNSDYADYENSNIAITTEENIHTYHRGKLSLTYDIFFADTVHGETKSPQNGETRSPAAAEVSNEQLQMERYNDLMNSINDEQRFTFNLLLSSPIPESIRQQAKNYNPPTAVRFRTNNRSSGVYDRDIRYNHDSLPPFEHALIYDMSAKLVFMGSLRMETPELDGSKVYELFQGDRIKSFDRVKFFYGHHFKHALPAIANIYKNEGRSAPPDTDYAKRVLNMYLQPVIDMASQTGPIRLLDETQQDTLNKIYNDLIPIGKLPAARIAMELAEHMNYDF